MEKGYRDAQGRRQDRPDLTEFNSTDNVEARVTPRLVAFGDLIPQINGDAGFSSAPIPQNGPSAPPEEVDAVIRRTFQALRIVVNDELSALDALLRQLPAALLPGGRVAILSFHSGEDRRVKKAFAAGLRSGVYEQISAEVIRPGSAERYANPRSAPAKLRWARRSGSPA